MSALLRLIVSTATVERVSRERSMVSREPRCFSRTFSPGLRPVRTVPTSCLRVARVAASRLTPSSALVMSPLFASRFVTRVSTRFSTERICGSCPASALFSSVVMVLSWLTPPPLRSMDRAPKTSSTSGFRLVRENGMRPALASVPRAVPSGGGASWMYFSPRRLDCSSRA